jgi:hypothetical protein
MTLRTILEELTINTKILFFIRTLMITRTTLDKLKKKQSVELHFRMITTKITTANTVREEVSTKVQESSIELPTI